MNKNITHIGKNTLFFENRCTNVAIKLMDSLKHQIDTLNLTINPKRKCMNKHRVQSSLYLGDLEGFVWTWTGCIGAIIK